MKSKLTVLVDMDGVLADFEKEVFKRLRERHPYIKLKPKRTNSYTANDYPEHRELVRSLYNEERFFSMLQLTEGALSGWQKIIDLGYKPRICSTAVANSFSEKEKLGWLEQHFVPVFGKGVLEDAVITREKYKYDGIALIDDKPELPMAEDASWQHIIFDAPYNQKIPGPRLFGWNDPNLIHLLRAAEERSVHLK